MANWDIFYNFLNDLKRDGNIAVLEAVEKGVSVLFEDATVGQLLKSFRKKSPMHKEVFDTARTSVIERLKSYDPTEDDRPPFGFLFDSKKPKQFTQLFVNWITYNIVEQIDISEVTEDITEQINLLTQKFNNPRQMEMFHTPKERAEAYKLEVQKIMYKNNSIDDVDTEGELKDFFNEIESADNAEEVLNHSGAMAGWGEGEYEEWMNERYQHSGLDSEHGSEAVSGYLWDHRKSKELLANLASKDYSFRDLRLDTDNWLHDSVSKLADKISKTVGREEYEEADVIVEMDNNFVWVDSSQKSCSAEAKQMGHCGNEHGPDVEDGDSLWSLRSGDGPSDWVSHITVIINGSDIVEGKRLIKQIKGDGPKTGNTKPSDEYHPYILKLLTSKDSRTGKYIVDGFYDKDYHAPGSNFKLSDLDDHDKKLLYNVRPELFTDVERTVDV